MARRPKGSVPSDEAKVSPDEGLALFDKEKEWGKVEVLDSRQALSRKVVNQHVDHVRRVYKWACSEELIPQAVYQALTTVAGLWRSAIRGRYAPSSRLYIYGCRVVCLD
jgi:hypothetical protein